MYVYVLFKNFVFQKLSFAGAVLDLETAAEKI